MDDFFRLNPAAGGGSGELHHHHHHQVQANTMASDGGYRVGTNHDDHVLLFDQTAQGMGSSSSSSSHHHMSDLMKTQIANHPRFPELLAAYLECQKVGAPPETKHILEQMGGLSHPLTNCSEIGADPELDDFMQTYTEVLRKYKEELTKPFDEATEFLSNIQTQLSNLCNGTSDDYHSDEGAGSSEEEVSIGEVEEAAAAAAAVAATESLDIFGGGPIADQDLKDMLLHKYSGYLSGLRKEFQKKRKKGKLPRAARIQLMEWWTTHYRWPYPTEEEKVKLSEITKLDQKQINNWFINQRKRHWKPSEDMRYALFEGVIGGAPPPMVFDAAAAAPGVGNANINHRR